MSDEDNLTLNTEAEEEVSLPTPSVDEPKATEEAPEIESEPTGEEESQNEEETEKEEPKKGYSNRVRELVKERNQAKEEAKSLSERLKELTTPAETPEYTPTFNAGDEISPEQYQSDVMRRADALVSLRMKQQEAVSRINNEATDVIKAYSELDPDSDNFNSELSEAITEATESYIKQNPYSASVKTYVDKLMKPYKGAVVKEVGKATETMAKQVSESALRPTSVKQEGKTVDQKSIEELEQDLGIVIA